MNKYLISLRELRYIEIEAATPEEAEVKAFESDAWNILVEEYDIKVTRTSDPQAILEMFKEDFDHDE